MTTDAELQPTPVTKLSHETHLDCIVCGLRNPIGWKLQFQVEDDAVVLQLHLSELLQGYSGVTHGGVVATLLDAAMTHSLFANGIEAVTGDLNIRYRYPVPVNATVTVRAWIDLPCPPLYKMKSEVIFNEKVLARASARFVACEGEVGEESYVQKLRSNNR